MILTLQLHASKLVYQWYTEEAIEEELELLSIIIFSLSFVVPIVRVFSALAPEVPCLL